MLPLSIPTPGDGSLNVLCLGAHCDDIEIGCGATLLTLLENYPNVSIYWQVFCSTEVRKDEGIRAAEYFCSKALHFETNILSFRDGYLPAEFIAVKDSFEQLKGEFRPDVIFTHYRDDRHQDHREISNFTWNTFRNHLILEYEIPKWDGDLGAPNTFVPINAATADAKVQALQSFYGSQSSKSWFEADLFNSIMRIRGMESNSSTGLAEAFYVRKAVFGMPVSTGHISGK